MYSTGLGVSQDDAEAVTWYRLAAEQVAEAQLRLGVAYTFGVGVSQDFAEGVKWFRRAAEQGNAEAQFNLGQAYAVGHVVSEDYVEAYMWLHYCPANTSFCSDKSFCF